MAQLYIAAAHKSSGKTSLSVGLTAALVKRGLVIQTFKKGPDYIDPQWLARATGRPCYNLDFFTQTHSEIIATFSGQSATADISLIEGNKGLYDGLDVTGCDSNAALAILLGSPVLLVIDCGGMTRGIAPLVNGYQAFDKNVDIRAVILNKVGGSRHEAKLRAALESYTDTEVVGVLGRDTRLEIPERHLGLVPASEASGARAADTMIMRLADAVTGGVDLESVIGIAKSAPQSGVERRPQSKSPATSPVVRVAIARDTAFGFYYPDDLEAFGRAGAELVPFDTLKDRHLPAVDGLFIGGGFPETQLKALSANQSLIKDIRKTLAGGMPAYAECGGLMYLARRIRWRDETREMVGFVPADVIVAEHPQGRGYMRLEETGDSPWPPGNNHQPGLADVPVHEFHYACLEQLPDDMMYTHHVLRGTGIDGRHDGLVLVNLVAGFAHHRNTRANPWVARFVDFVRQKSQRGL